MLYTDWIVELKNGRPIADSRSPTQLELKKVKWIHVYNNDRFYIMVNQSIMEDWLDKDFLPSNPNYRDHTPLEYYLAGKRRLKVFNSISEEGQQMMLEMQNHLTHNKAQRFNEHFELLKKPGTGLENIKLTEVIDDLVKQGALNSSIIFVNPNCVIYRYDDHTPLSDFATYPDLKTCYRPGPEPDQKHTNWNTTITSIHIDGPGGIRLSKTTPPPLDYYFWGPGNYPTLPPDISGKSESLQSLQQV
jgi:hypothetical protein